MVCEGFKFFSRSARYLIIVRFIKTPWNENLHQHVKSTLEPPKFQVCFLSEAKLVAFQSTERRAWRKQVPWDLLFITMLLMPPTPQTVIIMFHSGLGKSVDRIILNISYIVTWLTSLERHYCCLLSAHLTFTNTLSVVEMQKGEITSGSKNAINVDFRGVLKMTRGCPRSLVFVNETVK